MNNQILEETLTPAAREALDELTNDFQKQLLSLASRNNFLSKSFINEVTIRDIMNAVHEYDSKLINHKAIRKQRFLIVISILGLMYSLFGFLYLFYRNSKLFWPYNLQNNLGMILIISGFIVSVSANVISYILNNKQTTISHVDEIASKSDFTIRFLNIWVEIELNIKIIVAHYFGESSLNEPISKLINMLKSSLPPDSKIYFEIVKLLQIRNKIVHMNYSPSNIEINKIISDANSVLRYLEKRKDHLDSKL